MVLLKNEDLIKFAGTRWMFGETWGKPASSSGRLSADMVVMIFHQYFLKLFICSAIRLTG